MGRSVSVGPASEVGDCERWTARPGTSSTRPLTSYLLGEFDALGVCQGFGLFVDVLYIQDLAHELDHRLSTVEGCC